MKNNAQKNAAIRAAAASLKQSDYPVLAVANVICILVMFIPSLLSIFGITSAVASAIAFVVSVLLYPIATLGAKNIYLRKWRGESVSIKDLFVFASGRLYKDALILGAVYSIITLVIGRFQSLNFVGSNALVALIVAIVAMWITFRLSLMSFLFCDHPERKPLDIVSESSRLMKGNCWRMFCLMASTMWWRIILCYFSISIIAIPVMGVLACPQQNALNIASIFAVVLFGLISPYVYIAEAGFANELMPGTRKMLR